MLGDLHDLGVIEVQAGNCIVGLRLFRFLFDGEDPVFRVKLHHAKFRRICHRIPEDDGPSFLRLLSGGAKNRAEALPIKDVVAQRKAGEIPLQELLSLIHI